MDSNYNFNKCNICKIRGYITCNLCENQVFFCSRGHLHTHQMKFHKDKKQNFLNNELGNNNECLKNDSNFINHIFKF